MRWYETALNKGFQLNRTDFNKEKTPYFLSIDSKQTFQNVLGFGGAFTEAAAYNFSKMSKPQQDKLIDLYFHPEHGLGYTLGRIAMNSCDFALGNYTYVDENDEALETFSIERERRWVIPMIHRANQVALSPVQILVSPWSPPAWMKTNQQMNHGGQLKKEYYPLWAQYFVTFLDHIKKENVDVFAVSAQNEPAAVQTWDSCIYSPEEEGAFVLDHLGPALKASAHADTKVLIWDHNRDVIEERVTPILSDPRAKDYVWGVAFHWYVSEAFENLSVVKDKFPDTHLLFTEGCIEGGVKLGAYGSGERYMRNMIGDFSNGCEGYIEWNLMLDMQGGPNHVGNYCDAPIICDVDNDHFHVNSSYHAIGHFSRHVKPGAKRIKSQLDHPFITHIAFINPSGETVVILQNETEESTTLGLSVEGEAYTFAIEPHSYSTIVF
jgi:glucosylceramidase